MALKDKILAFRIPDDDSTITILARRNAGDQLTMANLLPIELAHAGVNVAISGFFSHKVKTF